MNDAQVHYEVMARRQQGAPWTLQLATEERARAIETAEEMLAEGRCVAVRVTKETLDEDTREFKSVSILNKGAPETAKPKKPREDTEPLCVSPQDLYTLHAREVIGRLLEGWLARQKATPFELLHRPDLIEKLDASGMDLQHAVQKVAVPEAQARGIGVHEIMRSFHKLAQAAIDRVLKDAKTGVLPRVDTATFAAVAEKLVGHGERHYLLGAGVAGYIGVAASWPEKVNRLLDLADAAPQAPAARTLAFHVLEEPLAEMLGGRSGLMELLGPGLDLGGSVAAMARLAASEMVESLVNIDPAVSDMMPPIKGAAARLANWLDGPHFNKVRTAIARRVLEELTGPKRLRPGDPEGEIALLRALAMALTAAAGRLLTLEEVQDAFVARSQMLLRSAFVEDLLGTDRSAIDEVQALLYLAENIAGQANKRQAARWIAANVGALRFETDFAASTESASAKLAALARLQRAVAGAGFVPEDALPIVTQIGTVAAKVEADAQLINSLVRAEAPVLHRLTFLLKLASGHAAPIGPVTERAKAEAIKLMRAPQTREALTQSPESLDRVRSLMQTAGLAA
ncbi:MAG TPA: hypothetical protein VHY32_10690 [Caulobacteraceae bacterium]|jgi:hypothetical protein|nr:hypothetical protein [Caulobacteraceae bacterium]